MKRVISHVEKHWKPYLILAILLFVIFVWPTPYEYVSVSGELVKVNRISRP
ncbi:unnamed protein product [marine sediment metagenome]|uniref:Uncharacterized protein n=1 Tax=marine sediment metagenome TaxID=412755 RepID=X0T4N1_9ZZZZ